MTVSSALTAGIMAPGPGGFVPVQPFRLVDTRQSDATSIKYPGPALAAGSVRTFQVVDPSSRPGWGIGAVALNVTAVDPSGSGFVTVWPAGQIQPSTSVVNFRAGQIAPNAVTVRVGVDGSISVYSNATTHLVVDVLGYFADSAVGVGVGGGGFTGVTPIRLLDTRPNVRLAGSSLPVRVTGVAGVPVDAAAVILNVTAIPAGDPGFVTVFPQGMERPETSNLNTDGIGIVANQVTVRPGADGAVKVFTQHRVDLVVDVMGWYAAGAPIRGGFVPVAPTRLMDSRSHFGPYARDNATGTVVLDVAGGAGVPHLAAAVSLNVTVTGSSMPGFLALWPDGGAPPVASSLNFGAGQTTANAVTVGLGRFGGVEISTNADPAVIVDVAGWYTSAAVLS